MRIHSGVRVIDAYIIWAATMTHFSEGSLIYLYSFCVIFFCLWSLISLPGDK